jgi:two-component system CheB/CheR fusion protein
MRLAREINIRTWPSFRASADAGGVAVKGENPRLRVITDELSHRIKNVVGIIQSIARQTMRQTTTKNDFDARLSGRREAFGRSLDLLVANDWHGAHIDELVRSELTAFGVLDGAQIAV